MSIQLPDRPIRPDLDPSDPQYAAKMLDYQQQLSEYQMAVQITQQELVEETNTTTNMERAQHDAMMAIIRNLS